MSFSDFLFILNVENVLCYCLSNVNKKTFVDMWQAAWGWILLLIDMLQPVRMNVDRHASRQGWMLIDMPVGKGESWLTQQSIINDEHWLTYDSQ